MTWGEVSKERWYCLSSYIPEVFVSQSIEVFEDTPHVKLFIEIGFTSAHTGS